MSFSIENQPWVTCYLTDMLLAYMQETAGTIPIDWAALFREGEGFEAPPNPQLFLSDVNNWVPLSVLRGLESECERVSRQKDFAYHAAKAYFHPGKKKLPSLSEIIVRLLDDVRSALICANLWGSVQTNYLKLHSLQIPHAANELYMVAQFAENARPAIGTIHLLRGFCEGFPQLYPFVEEVTCREEVSQLRIDDVAREFPSYSISTENDRLLLRHRESGRLAVEATKVPLKIRFALPDSVVALAAEQAINVPGMPIEAATGETSPPDPSEASLFGYQITIGGTLSHGPFLYTMETGKIYNAPCSLFRITWKEKPRDPRPLSIEQVRKEASRLLFDHLRQIKETHMRMVEFNIEKRRLTLENIHLRREVEREYAFAGIVGHSQKIKDLTDLVRSIADTDVTVLIQGETGTGKELIARAIHYNSGRRAKRFMALNCGALSETLLESELFGHERGAFTGASTQRKGIFEAADGGTLFLDEIGEVAASTQVKLLRVLQEGELLRVGGNTPVKVDVRIIAATNQNLEELVRGGRFRQDLFFRLNVFPIYVPPLRERAEDIPPLVFHFIEKNQAKLNKRISVITPQALAALMAYRWPGNVRELENVVQRTLIVCKSEVLDLPDLPPEIRGTAPAAREKAPGLKGITKESAELVEKNAILDALSKASGNITRAAKALGISRATLQNKMKLYGLRERKP
ncbi:MAG TPA: sigma 54-interacting transcriptional regulator [Candidatus Acidoferrales bacterium]|nr:sigma 54-interacting transcriptional regulator [Candidatus Acidoferrales bacterium]